MRILVPSVGGLFLSLNERCHWTENMRKGRPVGSPYMVNEEYNIGAL
jgi:hypothetical protein